MNRTLCTRLAAGTIGAGVLALVAIAAPVGPASAATSKPVVLGKSNKTATTTTIQNTKGTALSLKSPSGKPPLSVTSTGKVKKLNADMVDGLSASAFAEADEATGTFIAGYPSPAECPDGTVATGGGGFSNDGIVFYSGPGYDEDFDLVPNSWQVIGDTADTDSYVKCLSPTGGPIPGSIEDGLATGRLTAAQKSFLGKQADAVRMARIKVHK